jgi:hypothetical protein
MVCGDVDAVTERGRSRACPAGPFMALIIIVAQRNRTDNFARRREEYCNAWD